MQPPTETAPPVEDLVRVSPFPSPRVTRERLSLSALARNGKRLTVLHLYTG